MSLLVQRKFFFLEAFGRFAASGRLALEVHSYLKEALCQEAYGRLALEVHSYLKKALCHEAYGRITAFGRLALDGSSCSKEVLYLEELVSCNDLCLRK
jgi:hypothetical protein